MKIAITGGTGFVGQALTQFFIKNGHTVYILTRTKKTTIESGIHYVQWLIKGSQPEAELENMDVFINLAGEPLNSGRWTETKKAQIYKSRIHSTKEVLRIIAMVKHKPSTLINGSAIGFYGTSREELYTESNIAHGNDFLAEVVHGWEAEAKKAETFGVRVVFARLGVILGTDDGALAKMVLPYKFYVGGTVGSGQQWLSWIHIEDVVRLIHFAIEKRDIKGALNVVAPHPVIMRDFGHMIAKVTKRPHWLPAPSLALKLLLGSMSILILEGQKVLPRKAEENSYKFSFPYLEEALNSLLQ